ncbi:hypothetical protein, partial [Enterovibrio norvegicus]|uniref:hypothetical protein n=1 Tax=Enterovibrio norvegicus TaxID=188144 RepID=UPI000555A607
ILPTPQRLRELHFKTTNPKVIELTLYNRQNGKTVKRMFFNTFKFHSLPISTLKTVESHAFVRDISQGCERSPQDQHAEFSGVVEPNQFIYPSCC